MKNLSLIVVAGMLISLGCTPPQQSIKSSDIVPEIAASATYEGKGASFHEPVVVKGVNSHKEGIAAEYRYISDIHGKRGEDWFLVGQTLIKQENKVVDVVEIQLNTNERKIIFFDATDFINK
ncbi:MAG: hypothetical protein N2053_03235 [Chitinispirillaceae bacterium]|nr:hypothetical protein [Chitinispirillaceae bacterium]